MTLDIRFIKKIYLEAAMYTKSTEYESSCDSIVNTRIKYKTKMNKDVMDRWIEVRLWFLFLFSFSLDARIQLCVSIKWYWNQVCMPKIQKSVREFPRVKMPYHILLNGCKFSCARINKYIQWWRLIGLPTTCICKRCQRVQS